jgi:hypothetical protein
MNLKSDHDFAKLIQWCAKHGYSWHSKANGKQVIIDKSTNAVVKVI